MTNDGNSRGPLSINQQDIVTGDLGFNADDNTDKQEENQNEENILQLSSNIQGAEDLPHNPIFDEFKEYKKLEQFSVEDMKALNIVPLKPVRQ